MSINYATYMLKCLTVIGLNSTAVIGASLEQVSLVVHCCTALLLLCFFSISIQASVQTITFCYWTCYLPQPKPILRYKYNIIITKHKH